MTREDGLELVNLTFFTEEYHNRVFSFDLDRTQDSNTYWPSMRMIRHIPIVVRENQSSKYEVNTFELSSVCRYPSPMATYRQFIKKNKNKSYESAARFPLAQPDEESHEDFYRKLFGDLHKLFDTSEGFELLVHTLAHNLLLASIFAKRLELWDEIAEFFCNKGNPVNNDNLKQILSKYPEHSTYLVNEGTGDIHIGFIHNVYVLFLEYFRIVFEPLRSNFTGFIGYIAELNIETFNMENKYNYKRESVLAELSGKTVFGTTTPWETYPSSSEREYFDLSKKYNDLFELMKSVNHYASYIPSMNNMISNIKTTTENTNSRLSNPTSRIFDYGIECGALSPPEGEDTRYIINGMLTTTLKKWFKFLKDIKKYKQEDLPTSSAIKTKLRRATSPKNRSRDEEARIIGDAIDKVKGWVNSND